MIAIIKEVKVSKPTHLVILDTEYERRRLVNKRYSLRAFARSLDIDAGLLSKVLRTDHTLSLARARRLAEKLGLEGDGFIQFCESIAQLKVEKQMGRVEESVPVKILDNDIVDMISNLYHYAILELTFSIDFKADARWIARRLKITVIDAQYALERLKRIGLLVEKDGKLVKADLHFQLKDKTRTSPALRKQQAEIIDRSRQALENQSIDLRSTTGMTMCIDPDKIPLAKNMINEFMFRLCELLESGKRKEVFQLSVSLFSLEK